MTALAPIENPFPKETFDLNAIYRKLQTAKGKVENIRVTEGQMLAKLRPQVETTGLGWENYCNTFLERTYRDVQRILAIARAPDPEEAAAEERAKAAEGMRKSRDDKRLSSPSRSTLADLTADEDEAPDLSVSPWPEKFAAAEVIDGEIEELLDRIGRLGEGQRATLFAKLRKEYEL